MKILLVYNPHAGNDSAKKILPDVEKCLVKRNIDFDLRLTDYPEHATRIISEADFGQYDAVAAAGGDGTLFEVVNGYYKNLSGTRIPLAVIPIGTGNAFARDLKMTDLSYKDAIDIMAEGKTRKIDVGKFTTHGEEYYFVNILGIGFVVDVTETARRLKLFGNLAYLLGVIWQTIFLKPYHLKMEIDGTLQEMEAMFTEISNTRYTSNFLMAPGAKIDDGKFDITVLKKIGRLQLLKALPTVFTGDHVKLPIVKTWQGEKIKVITNTPKVLTPDGELLGISPVEVECLKQDIEVFWR
jgi:YegS/Rv2252/BmrU family lipid kinase